MRMSKVGLAIVGLCILLGGVSFGEEAAQKPLVAVDLIESAPYASWRNYWGKIKFGSDQAKIGCVSYKRDMVDGNGVQQKALLTPVLSPDGIVRGKYHLLLPEANKLLIKADVSAGYYGRVFIGIREKGKPIKYLIDKKCCQSKLEYDLTAFAGKEVDIYLKAKGTSWLGTWTYWEKAEILATIIESQKADLAVFPSSIKVFPIGDGSMFLEIKVKNIGKKDSESFKISISEESRSLEEIASSGINGKDEKSFQTKPLKITKGCHRIEIKLDAAGEEEPANNQTLFICQSPQWPVFIKNIEVSPFPWKGENIKVLLEGSVPKDKTYQLTYSIRDYYEKEVDKGKVKLTSAASHVNISPRLPQYGWFKIKASIHYQDKEISSLEEGFSRVPDPQPARKDSIFSICPVGVGMYYWAGEWQPPFQTHTLSLIKNLGASYVRVVWGNFIKKNSEKAAFAKAEILIKQGQIPYIFIGGDCYRNKPEKVRERALEAFKKFKYKDAYMQVAFSGEINGYLTPTQYAKLVIAFSEVKKVCPNLEICGPMFSFHAQSLLDSGKRGSSQEWLMQFYPQVRGYLDVLSTDGYSHKPPELWHDEFHKPLLDVVSYFGDLGKVQVANDEYNLAADSGTGSHASHIVRGYLCELGRKPRASQLQFFPLNHYKVPGSWGCTPLCKYNFYPKPAYQAYACCAYNLTGARFIRSENIGKDNYCYIFRKGRNTFAYIWKGVEEREEIVLPTKGKARIRDFMGGKIIPDVRKREIKLVISTDPILVRGLNWNNFRLISSRTVSKGSFEKIFNEASFLRKEAEASEGFLPSVWYNLAKKAWEETGSKQDVLSCLGKVKESLKEPFPVSISSKRKIPAHIVINNRLTLSERSPKNPITAKYTSSPVKVNGNLTEWKGRLNYTISENSCILFLGKKLEGDKELSAKFGLQWDDNNLYLALDVSDDMVGKWVPHGLKGYGGDGIEVIMDVSNSRKFSSGVECSHYYFGIDGGVTRIGKFTSSNAKVGIKKRKSGYFMEVSIPLEEICLKGVRSGHLIAFDIVLTDADGHSVDRILIWHGAYPALHHACGAGEIKFE